MSQKNKLEYSLKMFSDAISRFGEALNTPVGDENSIVIDACIQRFEFSFEMAWKTIKRFLEHKGIVTKAPRDCFKEAFKLGWISNDDLWSQMLEDRNRTSHTYNRKIANEVYLNLPQYFKHYTDLQKHLLTLVDQA